MKRSTAYSMPEFKVLVEKASSSSAAFIFNHDNHVCDYKQGAVQIFYKLPGFRKQFYYSIAITAVVGSNGERDVRVATSVEPGIPGRNPYHLRKKNQVIPTLDDDAKFPRIESKS